MAKVSESKATRSRKARARTTKYTKAKTRPVPGKTSWHRSKRVAEEFATRHKLSAEYVKARNAYYKYGRGILKKLMARGVVGLSYGPRMKEDKPTTEITIRVHVATKKAKQLLKKNAKQWGLKKTYGGVGIDIVVWDFKTTRSTVSEDGHGQKYSNGTRIECGDAFGTLGTKVVIFLPNNDQKGMWLTAAHVVADSKSDLSEPAPIFKGNKKIGTVSKVDYFRDSRFDVALIEPDPAISFRRSPRSIVPLFKTDKDIEVTKEGAKTNHTEGKVKLLDYDGTIESPTNPFEQVVNHFLVEGVDGKFAERGDSGACVVKSEDGSFIGVVRAATKGSGIGVITRLSVVVNDARRLVL